MCKRIVALITLLTLCSGAAVAGIVYPDPAGGWTYIYTGDAAIAGPADNFDSLDGTWDHDNSSDQWDGSGIGTGRPGGASSIDGYLRIQDTGDPRDHAQGDPGSNRKIMFGHSVTNDAPTAAATILDDGVTINFRARISTGAPLDDVHPDGGGATTPWPAGGDGYVIHDGGKDSFSFRQSSGDKIISFALVLASDDAAISADGLTMNNLNGTSPSGDVDTGEGGTTNLLQLDPTQWHEFWITIQADTSGGGTHRVSIYLDGDSSPVEFHVTAGGGNDYDDSYIGMGCGSTGQSGAIDIDFFGYKPGIIIPTGGVLKARDPKPANGAPSVSSIENFGMLSWAAAPGAAWHHVYFGTDFDDVNEATSASPEFKGRLTALNTFYMPTRSAGATYYWRIDEEDNFAEVFHGDVWSFTTAPSTASNPDPADGAAFVGLDPELTWNAGFDATTHDVYFGTDPDNVANATKASGEFKGNVVPASFTPGTLQYGADYYWRIDEVGPTTVKGNVWSFSTIPYIPVTDPNLLGWWKFDEGSGTVALDSSGHSAHGTLTVPTPTWAPGLVGGALDFQGNGDRVTAASLADSLNGLSAITIMAWIKSDVIGTDKGFIIFEEPSGTDGRNIRYDNTGSTGDGDDVLKMGLTIAATGGNEEIQMESSENRQTTDWQHIALVWASGEQLQLYIDGVLDVPTSNDDAVTGTLVGNTNVIIGQGNKDESASSWDGLIDDVRIYDKAMTAEQIKTAMRGDPKLAWDPKPANGASVDIGNASPLTWAKGDAATQHDVYFGASRDSVANADTSTVGIYRTTLSVGTETYTPPETPAFGRTYYWRIDERNNDASVTKGMIWSFTVTDFILVDDFEDYNDYSPDRIFESWLDGFGYGSAPPLPGPYYPGNGTGSIVGYGTAPFAETAIVHGGDQAMPYFYNNNLPGMAQYSESTKNLTYPRDWTQGGAKALSLWFRGYPASSGGYNQLAGTFTVRGSGTDIWDVPGHDGFHDEFHFVYKTLTGAGSIIAKVESVQNTNGWAKAGVMLRDTLDPNSINGLVAVSPSNGITFQGRVEAGEETTSDTQGGLAAPYWVKLERDAAGYIGGWYSVDGTNWTQLGNYVLVSTGSTVYVGLAVTSHNINQTCEAVFSNVQTTGSVGAFWNSQDIGILANDAEPMYVALTSGATTGVVYHEDPNAAQTGTWTEWNIDLKEFQNQGVTLSNVGVVAIGFGNRNAPQAGGSGVVYFDDIRLYGARYIPGKGTPLAGDLNNDGVVYYPDVEIMADEWLESDSVIATQSPTTAPVAWWKLDNTTTDSAGASHGTAYGAPVYGAGKAGQAMVFDGSNDYLTMPDTGGTEFGTGSFTLSFWLKSSFVAGSAKQFIICNGTNGSEFDAGGNGPDGRSTGKRYVVKFEGSNLQLLIDDDVTKTTLNAASRNFATGEWVHAGIVRDTDVNELRIYCNGAPANTGTDDTAESLDSLGEPLYIGAKLQENDHAADQASAEVDHYFAGMLDDIRFFAKAIPAAEIAYLADDTPGDGVLYVPLNSPANLVPKVGDPGVYNPANPDVVNFKDFAVLADEWLEEQIWPEW